MKIEIKSRWDDNVILCGEYENIKDCLEKNRGAYLEGANLRGANLRGAYLRGANLRGANLMGAYLRGANLRGAYLEGAYLRGANLRGAYLEGANLRDAYLMGAYLEGAYLEGAKEYYMSHDICFELIKRQKIETFTPEEWVIIGQVTIHRFCWTELKKRYGKKLMPIFEKLNKVGFDEYEKHYKELK